jgi:hypothetical protein
MTILTTHPGTPYETIFELVDLGADDGAHALLGPEGADADDLDWPTDAQICAALGWPACRYEAGDHPTRPEAIVHPDAD